MEEMTSDSGVPIAVDVHETDVDAAAQSGGVEERARDVDAAAPSGEVIEEAVDAAAAPSGEVTEEAVDVQEAAVPSGEVAEAAVDGAAPSGDVREEAADIQEPAAPSGEVKEEAEGMDVFAESVGAESLEEAEPSEAADAHVEEVATFGDVEEKAVEVETRDLNGGEASPETPGEALDAAVGEAVAPADAEPAAESVPVSSDDVEEKAVEVNSEEASSVAMPDEVVSEAAVPSIEMEEEAVDAQEAAVPSGEVKEEAVDVQEAAVPSAEVQEEAVVVHAVSPSEDVEERALDAAAPSEVVGACEEVGGNGDGEGVAAAIAEVEVEGAADDVGEKSVEVNSEEPATESSPEEADSPPVVAAEDVGEKGVEMNLEEPAAEVSDEVPVEEASVGEVVADAEAVDEPSQVEAAAPSKEDVEVNFGECVEEAEKASAEESLDIVDSAPVEAIADVADAEPEEKPTSEAEVSPKTAEDAPAEGMDVFAESVGAESLEKAEPSEAADAHVDEVATFGDVEEKAVEVEARDLNEGEASPETPGEALDAAVGEAVAPADAEPAAESVPVSSDDVEEKAVEVNSEEASSVAMPDEVVSEGRDAHVEEVVEEPTSAEPRAEASPAKEAPEKVSSEAIPVAETKDKVEDAAASVEPGVESTSAEVEPQAPALETEEQSAAMANSISLPAEDELFLLPTEGTREAETVSAEDRSFQVDELAQKSEPESQIRSIPTEAEVKEAEVVETPDAQSVTAKEGLLEPATTEMFLSVPMEHTSEEPSDAPAEPCDKDPLTSVLEHPTETVPSIIGSETKELPSIDDGVANGTVKSVDVSHLLQTVMPDEEVKAVAAVYSPEEEAGTQVLEAENVHKEPEVSAAFQDKEVETLTREFNLNDVSEVPITSKEEGGSCDSHVVAPYLAPARAAAGSESVEAAPKSYSLDEVASHLDNAAAKTLQDAEASEGGENQSTVAKTVAQIVLEESNNAKDSSEYISEVVQHVAQFAQDAVQSDPNVLPDTVARVFDGETTASPANEVTQSKGTTSLGTMVSLFVIWCVSLCASRVSSKDMPAPALKLAVEEVTAVLQTNTPSQSTSAAQGTITSSH